jgi:hypothetical protein
LKRVDESWEIQSTLIDSHWLWTGSNFEESWWELRDPVNSHRLLFSYDLIFYTSFFCRNPRKLTMGCVGTTVPKKLLKTCNVSWELDMQRFNVQ